MQISLIPLLISQGGWFHQALRYLQLEAMWTKWEVFMQDLVAEGPPLCRVKCKLFGGGVSTIIARENRL